MLVSIISFLGLIASIVVTVRALLANKTAGTPTPKSAVVWACLFMLLQGFIGVYAALGLVQDDLLSALIMNAAIVGCTWTSANQPATGGKLHKLTGPQGRFPHPLVASILCILLAALFAGLALELPSNHDFTWVYPLCMLLEWALIAAAMTGLFFVFQRRGSAPGILAFALFGLGIAEYFVITFKSMPIQPGDLSALSTAMAVAGTGYTYSLSAFCLYGIAFLALSLLCCHLAGTFRRGSMTGDGADAYTVSPKFIKLDPDVPEIARATVAEALAREQEDAFERSKQARNDASPDDAANSAASTATSGKGKRRGPHYGWKGFILNLVIGLICFGGIAAHVTLIDYYNTLNISVYTWRPLESYWRQGFLPTFITGAQTIKPPVPQDYSMDDAEKLLDTYAGDYDATKGIDFKRAEATAQFNDDKPTVIAIMNETFSDLSIYQNLHADYQGPQFFKSLSDTLARGKLFVSAYGGGTCNTEFEFLTGNSMAYLGSGVYPYTIYDLTQTENLAAQFKQLGYSTTAMHPNHGTNWNRENVYRDFGFDQFLTIQDFQDADKLRGMVTDKATYDKILRLLDEDQNPQFIFDVTMQNHSGYDTGLIPADKQLNLTIDGISDPEVNEYVSLIQQSDEALRYFIGQLRKLDRKVVVVFFGDHQPFFPSTYNDLWFTDEDQATHAERLWQTDYIIWANYDVAGHNQDGTATDLSTNYLGATLMDLIGAPVSTYQKAQLSLRDAMPAINSTGYEDRSLRWYLSTATATNPSESADAAGAEQARDDYAKIQYYKLFGDGKDVYTKHAQTAANETDPNLAPGTTKVK